MTDFVSFCRARGILIDAMPPFGKWESYPTDDKPGKKNGRVRFMGDHGHAHNWGTMEKPDVWQLDKESTAVDPQQLANWAAQAEKKQAARREAAAEAARKAAGILNACRVATHPYLATKGFPEAEGNVYDHPTGGALLVVPMRIAERLVGLQFIAEGGEKRFMAGQQSKGAELVIDNKGVDVLLEGFATALSVQAALQAARVRYRIHCCFSASNMIEIGKKLPGKFITIADNDASLTGENAALELGAPYWMSATVGHDANDDHRARGLFALSQELKLLVMGLPR